MFLTLAFAAALQLAAPLTDYPPASERLRAATPAIAARSNVILHGYEVSGRNWRQLETAMAANGPHEEGAGELYGYTVTRLTPRFVDRTTDCDPTTIEVALEAAIILPDLATRDQLSARDQVAWDAFFERLIRHEVEHLSITERGIPRVLASMRDAPDCFAAFEAGLAIDEEVYAESVEFDRRTDHGRLPSH